MTRPRRALGGVRPTPTVLVGRARDAILDRSQTVAASARDVVATVADRVRGAEPRRDLIRTGVAGLTIAALGLGVAGAMAATSSADNSVLSAHVSGVAAGSSSAGTPNFERRGQSTSRDSTRPDITSAQQQRAADLATASRSVADAGEKAALDERAKELAGASSDTAKAARKMESEKAKKVLPLDSYRIAAGFGAVGLWARYHTGTDFSAALGTPIHAAAGGVVTHAGTGGEAGGWAGSYVVIQHEDGYSTLYAHMNPGIAVTVGQTVAAGDLIGHVGLTGRTFGPHCHVELYPPGTTPGDIYAAVNLLPWLNA